MRFINICRHFIITECILFSFVISIYLCWCLYKSTNHMDQIFVIIVSVITFIQSIINIFIIIMTCKGKMVDKYDFLKHLV